MGAAVSDSEKTLSSRMLIEGLASQIRANEYPQGCPWWHLIREDVREQFRKRAAEKIAEYERHIGRAMADD